MFSENLLSIFFDIRLFTFFSHVFVIIYILLLSFFHIILFCIMVYGLKTSSNKTPKQTHFVTLVFVFVFVLNIECDLSLGN